MTDWVPHFQIFVKNGRGGPTLSRIRFRVILLRVWVILVRVRFILLRVRVILRVQNVKKGKKKAKRIQKRM